MTGDSVIPSRAREGKGVESSTLIIPKNRTLAPRRLLFPATPIFDIFAGAHVAAHDVFVTSGQFWEFLGFLGV